MGAWQVKYIHGVSTVFPRKHTIDIFCATDCEKNMMKTIFVWKQRQMVLCEYLLCNGQFIRI